MTLYEYIKKANDGEEITVCDAEYDIEVYFYNDKPDDEWQRAMLELAKLLTVTEECGDGVTVDLSNLVERKIEKLKNANLFFKCKVDTIMYDMNSILSGYVSEDWLCKFVTVLKED